MALTEASCRRKANAEGRAPPFKLSDGGGLHLFVKAEAARYWRLAYRLHGKQRTLALGVYPAVSLADARAAREAAKRDLAKGIDPSTAKKEQARAARMAAGNTFEALAREWHAKWKPGKALGYADQVLRRLEADVFPVLGRRPIAEIEPPDVLDALQKIEGRGVGETARRIKQVVGQVFRHAIITGRAKRNPTTDLQGALNDLPAPRHHNAMPREDLPGFLRNIDSYDGEPRTRLALRLVTLTFVRTTELRAAKWDEFEDSAGHPYSWDSDAPPAQWRIPAARMKRRRDHIVPLSRQAVAALRELRPLAGNSDHLFPSPSKGGIMSQNTLLFALYRMGYHGRATTHGFRGVASTMLNESGWESDWVELQLAHVEANKVRGAYNAAQWMNDRRRMMQWWADQLDAVAHEQGNVVALRAG